MGILVEYFWQKLLTFQSYELFPKSWGSIYIKNQLYLLAEWSSIRRSQLQYSSNWIEFWRTQAWTHWNFATGFVTNST